MTDSYSAITNIDEQLKFFGSTDTVLDIGTSDTGFAKYASEKAGRTIGVDLPKFKTKLDAFGRKHNISLKYMDIIRTDISPTLLSEGDKVNAILLHLPLSLITSTKLLGRILPILADGGKVLISVESRGQDSQSIRSFAEKLLSDMGLSQIKFVEAKKRLYACAVNTPEEKTLDVIAIT